MSIRKGIDSEGSSEGRFRHRAGAAARREPQGHLQMAVALRVKGIIRARRQVAAAEAMKTSADLALEIVQFGKEHPRWGPKKLVAIMAKRHPGMTVWPNRSNIAAQRGKRGR